MTGVDPACPAIVAAFRRRNVRLPAPSGAAARAPMFRRRGSSYDLRNIREYQGSDDPRAIDWKLYGRTDRAYVKEFYDEASEGVAILADLSASMAVIDQDGYRNFLASLAFILAALGLGVSLWLYDSGLRGPRLALRQASGIRRVVDALDSAAFQGDTDTARAYAALRGSRGERRVVVVSDFHERGLRLAPPPGGTLFLVRFRRPFTDLAGGPGEFEVADPESGRLVVLPWDRAAAAEWAARDRLLDKTLAGQDRRVALWTVNPGSDRAPVYWDILERLYG